jgi:4-amino-4-deoxy-L-arabinose transferase-like glycosyltransferase
MAFGPITFVIQALFFKLFGVSWTSTVLSAAFVGAAAALSVMRIVRLLFGVERSWLSGLAGLLVGTSFQAVFGTLMMEQVGFLFSLLGIQAICESLKSTRTSRLLYFALAGIFTALAFLSKQNVGVLTFVLLGFLIIMAALPAPLEVAKDVACFLLGTAAAAGLFALWLMIFSDPHLFVRHALEVPSQIGRGRIVWRQLLFLPSLLSDVGDTTPWCSAVALGSVFRAVYLSIVDSDFRHYVRESPTCRLAIGLATAIPFFQAVFQMTTLNSPCNVAFWSALSLASGVGLLFLMPGAAGRGGLWAKMLACFISVFLLFEMVFHSWNRSVHDVFPNGSAHLSRPLRVPGLQNVFWISPTTQGDVVIDPQSINAVGGYLVSNRHDFLLIGDSSYLYGLSGVVPPQPLLYFQANHYYLKQDIPAIDDWILTDLRKRDIRMIVREKKNVFGDFPFPSSNRWIAANFQPGPAFGNFEILLR